MSLLGKILLFVNLLAAGGLAYLTAQDWSKRQEVAAKDMLYNLMLVGLPVDAPQGDDPGPDYIPLGPDVNPAGVPNPLISKKYLDQHFGNAGPAPKTQIEEVQKLRQRVEEGSVNQGSDLEKVRFLCGTYVNNQFQPGILMRFADTFEERQAIRALATAKQDPQAPVRNQQVAAENAKEARRRLSRKFDAVLNPPNPAAAQQDAQRFADLQGKLAANPKDAATAAELNALLAEGLPAACRDENDRRNRIAQLLMLSNVAADNQKKVIYIVGLKTYARAVNEQVGRMEEMYRRTIRLMEQDQAKFSAEYELLKQLAVEQDQILFQQQRVLTGLKAQAAEDDKALGERQKQFNYLETQLGDLNRSVADVLAAQAKTEAAIFETQKKIGQTMTDNLGLEGKLLKTEEGK